MNEYINYLILILVGLFAGVVNTLAGGGSILTLPILIFMGLPPAYANGTNRVGIFLQTFTGVIGFKSKGVSVMPHGLYWGLAAMIGSIIGANLAIDIKAEAFNRILGIVIIFVVALTIYKPKNIEQKIERVKGKFLWISLFLFFLIGVFGGFIQAGAGLFIMLVLSQINHISLVKSNAVKSMIVAVYTFAALMVFIYYDEVNWIYGLLLAFGQSIGAWFSSRWSVKKDDNLIRFFLIVAAFGMAIKLWFF